MRDSTQVPKMKAPNFHKVKYAREFRIVLRIRVYGVADQIWERLIVNLGPSN